MTKQPILTRAKLALALGESMGLRTSHPSNTYNVLADLIAELEVLLHSVDDSAVETAASAIASTIAIRHGQNPVDNGWLNDERRAEARAALVAIGRMS